MSYCRFSSMDFQCDLYVYHDVGGHWQIYVAGQKKRISLEDLPEVPPWPENGASREEIDKWAEAQVARQKEVYKRMEEVEYTPIGLPHDGEAFALPSPGECADQCQKLIDMGYVAPDDLVSSLRAEQAELDNPTTPLLERVKEQMGAEILRELPDQNDDTNAQQDTGGSDQTPSGD